MYLLIYYSVNLNITSSGKRLIIKTVDNTQFIVQSGVQSQPSPQTTASQAAADAAGVLRGQTPP